MKELFSSDQVSSLSPKIRWKLKHNLQTLLSPECEPPWAAWSGDLKNAIDADILGYGQTEDDALVDWAKENGVRLWNEEPL